MKLGGLASFSAFGLSAFGLFALAVFAQDAPKPLEVVQRLKIEAFDESQVMETLSFLSDHYGPRLTGSPEFEQAAAWAMDRLKSYGVANVHEEAWGPFGRSWSIESYSVDMIAPRYSHLVAAPLAWSRPTNGTVQAEVVLAGGPGREYDPRKLKAQVDEFEAKWKGKLRGKIVLATNPKAPTPSSDPNFQRLTPDELGKIASAPEPAIKKNIDLATYEYPDDPQAVMATLMALPVNKLTEFIDLIDAQRNRLAMFLADEGALAVLREDARAHNGSLNAEAAGSEKAKDKMALPTFIVTEEQYSRMTRLLERHVPVTVAVNLKVKYSETDVMGQDIIGEIPGSTKADEVVMIGAHYDSWHTGTGATDNGAGSAVMIEVMRILKALNLPMKRTVRIGLWSGEEQGLYGSIAYVTQHFGDAKTMQLKPEHAKLDAYLNLDNGSGKIRGVYLQGNDAARPVFEEMLAPFRDMGVTTITVKDTGGTDHQSFDAVGLPGFQFIQDPLDYGSLTHHSNMDTYTHAVPEDLMQASAVIATLVYDIANREERFPRKALPVAAK